MNHDTTSFCEGLVKYKKYLFESSGAFKSNSFIIKYDLLTGKVIKRYEFPDKNDFAEGITILNKEVICVMWKTEKIYYFDLELKLKRINFIQQFQQFQQFQLRFFQLRFIRRL